MCMLEDDIIIYTCTCMLILSNAAHVLSETVLGGVVELFELAQSLKRWPHSQ